MLAERSSKKPMPLKDYLKKQGPKRLSPWQKRYFLQTEESLHYFKSHRDLAQGPKGFIDLTTVRSVTIADEPKGIFELVTPNRVWRLQLCEESEMTLQQWVSGINAWLDYFELRKERQRRQVLELERRGISTPTITNYMINPNIALNSEESPPSINTTATGTITATSSLALDAYTAAELERLRTASDLLITQVAEQEAEIAGLKQRIELLQSEMDAQEHYKTVLIDQKREALKLAIIDTDRAIDEAKSQLRQLDSELQQSERECSELNSLVLEIEEQLQVKEAVAKAEEADAVDIAKQLAAQAANIKAYRSQIDQAKVARMKEMYGDLLESLEHIWLASAQQQAENEILMKKIQRLETQSNAELHAKKQVAEAIAKELEATEKAAKSLEDHFLQQEGIDRSQFDLLKELKEKLFISYAVGIKLWGDVTRTYKTREVDLGKLYKAAVIAQPDWKTWKFWLQSVLIDMTTLSPNAKLPVPPPTNSVKDDASSSTFSRFSDF